MEDQNRRKSEDQQSTNDEGKTEEVIKVHNPRVTSQNGAGTSTQNQNNLPGTVESQITRDHKYGLSQSEHSLRHIFTTKDVANALKLCSLSFSPVSASVKNLDLIKLKVPEHHDKSEVIDIKKFMADCLNLENEIPVKFKDTPVIHKQAIPMERVDELPNPTTLVHTQTDSPSVLEGVPIPTHSLEPKASKLSKKKLSANISARSDQSGLQRDSLSSIDSNVCRICMTRGRERLISPCYCKGSLANVHLSCLERWLNQVGRNHCELCGYSYPAIRTPRYTVLQALRLWFGNPRNRSHLQSDCLIFWLLSTVTAGLLAVCIVGTQYFVVEGNKLSKNNAIGTPRNEGISHRITETAMDFFMAIVVCGYSVTVYLLWKDHYVMWNRWRRANVNVRLLIDRQETTTVPIVPATRYNVV